MTMNTRHSRPRTTDSLPGRMIDFGKFLDRTRHLNPIGLKCYSKMMLYYWDLGELPASDSQSAEICNIDVRTFRRLKNQLGRLFDTDDTGRWRDHNLEAERECALAKMQPARPSNADGVRT